MTVGAWVILRPTGAAVQPEKGRAPPDSPGQNRFGMLRIHQAGENPFGFLLPIRRYADVVVGLKTTVETERFLEREERADKRQPADRNPKHPPEIHGAPLLFFRRRLGLCRSLRA